MTNDKQNLWNKIRDFELDDPSATFSFSDRLARENGWKIQYTLRAVEEYKKFIFLLCIAQHPLTPSDEVDQVWHLHLLYTHSYWIDLCQNTLNKQIHHGPTKGGGQERSKFTDWYNETKLFYKKTFQTDPPVDIWPSSEVRFGEINFQRINMHRNWIMKKPTFIVK